MTAAERKLDQILRLLAWWDADGDIEFEDFISALRKIVNKESTNVQ